MTPCVAHNSTTARSLAKPPVALSTAVLVLVALSDLFIGALTLMLVVRWRHPILRLSQPLFLFVMACCGLVAVTMSLALDVESDLFSAVGDVAFAHSVGTLKCIVQVCVLDPPCRHLPPHSHAVLPRIAAAKSRSLGSSSL